MSIRFTGIVAAAVIATGTAATATTVSFDSFTTFQRVEDAPSGYPNTSTIAAAEAFGGYRTLNVSNDVQAGGSAVGDTALESAGGVLSFTNADGAKGTGSVTYDANGTGLGNLFAASGGATLDPYFFFHVGKFDNTADALFFASVSTATGTATYSEVLTGLAFDPKLYFSDFVGPADFSSVNSITFGITTDGPYDESLDGNITGIDLVGAIPLPAGGVLLLGGLAGLGGLAKLRKKRT